MPVDISFMCPSISVMQCHARARIGVDITSATASLSQVGDNMKFTRNFIYRLVDGCEVSITKPPKSLQQKKN